MVLRQVSEMNIILSGGLKSQPRDGGLANTHGTHGRYVGCVSEVERC